MLYNYLALAVFAIFAIAVPLSFVIGSKLIGRRSPGNAAKNAPWESGEESTGSALDIDNEYLSFFALFLPFEIIAAIAVVWAFVAYDLPYAADIGMVSLVLVSSLAAMAGYKMASG
jgi:NADH:ubiquinone oxidoreductase subunit 3 (subunit A)